MYRVTVIIQAVILLAFAERAYAKAEGLNHMGKSQLSMHILVNRLVDKLFDRLGNKVADNLLERMLESSQLKAFHNEDVDGMILQKPGHLAVRSSSVLGPHLPLQAVRSSSVLGPHLPLQAFRHPLPGYSSHFPPLLTAAQASSEESWTSQYGTAIGPEGEDREESWELDSPDQAYEELDEAYDRRRRGIDPGVRRRGREITNQWRNLKDHVDTVKTMHIRDLLQDTSRCSSMFLQWNGINLDFTRQKVTPATMELLYDLARAADVEGKRSQMFKGFKINEDEDRPVLHVALRAARDQVINVTRYGINVVPGVYEVLDQIENFSERVRSGEYKGYTGKSLTDVLCIGIGGSYLGTEFMFEALKTWPAAGQAAKGRRVRFLANVDPIDIARALDGLSAETTLVIVNSKTFTTAETMLNARTVKDWIIKELGSEDAVAKHVVACSTALDKTDAFGINPENVFRFRNWVGGRFSVTSAIGVLPLALQYGFDIVREFLDGARDMDNHFATAPIEKNLPTLLGLLAVWNLSCLNYEGYAVLPYCQALVRFVAHIQQLDMESNGKRVRMDGSECSQSTGGVYFGEPGTNGQHSFYQLLHQGRTIPADFIGFKKSQNPVNLPGEAVPNHDELMSNFFAQPDALALGYTEKQCRAAGVPEVLVPHKVFEGDRPSLSILMPECSPYYLGTLLALYEHRTAVQGWIWDINSFDQWGVELGKVLGKKVRDSLSEARKSEADLSDFTAPTQKLLQIYLEPDS